MKINWSSLWKKEDWWAVWIGFIIIFLAIFKLIPNLPVIQKWDRIAISFPKGFSTLGSLALLFLLLLILTAIATLLMRNRVRQYIGGFAVVFCLSFLALWIGEYVKFATWGLETVLWALILGLVIGNLLKVPEWLKAAIQAEFFIKIGLVLLGAETLFSTL
ncbi:MAG: putative sulfate exporter family transporter, partial [Dehalococcoidales bacterium]|nr:putative sulfate exporter family transporter [Dehalococcoidales bacterium]